MAPSWLRRQIKPRSDAVSQRSGEIAWSLTGARGGGGGAADTAMQVGKGVRHRRGAGKAGPDLAFQVQDLKFIRNTQDRNAPDPQSPRGLRAAPTRCVGCGSRSIALPKSQWGCCFWSCLRASAGSFPRSARCAQASVAGRVVLAVRRCAQEPDSAPSLFRPAPADRAEDGVPPQEQGRSVRSH